MSGAAEGIAGLALSAVSVAALFTTCIQCFDLVVAGKNFSEDYEQLFAIFAIQRTRFGLWGESVGLIPNPNDGRCLPYNESINRRDIRPGIENILNNIRLLLQEADRVDEKYGLKIAPGGYSITSMSVGLNIFKDSFERFKGRIKKNQEQKSAWKVTQWAIHDAAKFETLINRLEKYVDGLEKLTDSLGRLQGRLREEINSLSDIQSLRLLRDASSNHRSTSKSDVSDTASRRIVRISEAGFETQTLATASITYNSDMSFATAESKPQLQASSHSSSLLIPGAWPQSVKSESSQKGSSAIVPVRHIRATIRARVSCIECLEEHYKCEPRKTTSSCSRCCNKYRSCSFTRDLNEEATSIMQNLAESARNNQQFIAGDQDSRPMPAEVPPNQHSFIEHVRNVKAPKPLSFEAGDAHYGETLKPIKTNDINSLLQNSAKFLNQASTGSTAAKRMFLELRDIRTANVPFVSAAPIGDSLDKVLASIEGPPETPYEGGVFWITARLSDKDVMGPPLIKFHTKIYHPNISPQGHICADYKEKWNSVFSTGPRSNATSSDAIWYHKKSRVVHWSLGALLTALCGLLASPDVEDPLVPEIAQTYLTDYAGYCEAARLYTQRYATRERPSENDVIFLDDEMSSSESTMSASSPLTAQQPDTDTASIQRSMRETYDEPFPKDITAGSSISKNSSGSHDRDDSNSTDNLLNAKTSYQSMVDTAICYSTIPASDDMIENFWNQVSRQWDFKNWWAPTHTDVGYGLLQRISNYNRMVPEGTRNTYIKYQKIINSFFANLVIDAKSVRLSDSLIDWGYFKAVVIIVENTGGQTWIALARRDHFIPLHDRIRKHRNSSIYFRMAVHNLESLDQNTPHSAKLLAKFLGQVLKLPKASLLATKEFVDLVEPAIDIYNEFVLAKYEPDRPRSYASFESLVGRVVPSLEEVYKVI